MVLKIYKTLNKMAALDILDLMKVLRTGHSTTQQGDMTTITQDSKSYTVKTSVYEEVASTLASYIAIKSDDKSKIK